MKILKLVIQFDSGARMEAKGNNIAAALPISILKQMKKHIDQLIKERTKEGGELMKGRKPAVEKPVKKKKVVKK